MQTHIYTMLTAIKSMQVDKVFNKMTGKYVTMDHTYYLLAMSPLHDDKVVVLEKDHNGFVGHLTMDGDPYITGDYSYFQSQRLIENQPESNVATHMQTRNGSWFMGCIPIKVDMVNDVDFQQLQQDIDFVKKKYLKQGVLFTR